MLANNRGPASPKTASRGGFTLIEVVVYLALFSILMGGLVTSAYAVTSGSSDRREAATIATEADFLQSKLAWDVAHNHSLTTVSLDASHHAIEESGVPLTSSNVVVSALTITSLEGAFDVSFVMDGELFSERYYLP